MDITYGIHKEHLQKEGGKGGWRWEKRDKDIAPKRYGEFLAEHPQKKNKKVK